MDFRVRVCACGLGLSLSGLNFLMQESMGTIFMVMTSIVAIPLTMITFYLRSLRDQILSWQRDFDRRMGVVESTMAELRSGFAELERDYTTKEEWLRECMYARQTIQQLLESVVRLETVVQKEEQQQNAPQIFSNKSSFVTDRFPGKSRSPGKSSITETGVKGSIEEQREGSV